MWRTARILLAIAALIAAGSLARTSWQRWGPRPAPQLRPAASVPPELATKDLKILMFYAPRIPERGRPSTLCYGVLNAARLELDPPLAELTPSISRCVEASIREATRVTLRAYDKAGRSVSETIEPPVRDPLPRILFADVSASEIRRGDRFTLCYGVRDAARVRVEPGPEGLPAATRHCATWFPVEAPRRLVAELPAGRTEVELSVRLIP